MNLLGTLEVEQHNNWVGHLPGLVQSYNNTIHSSTRYVPAFLMFGRHLRTPIDMLIGAVSPEVATTTDGWVNRHHRQLSYAYSKTTAHLKQAAEANKRVYDRTSQDAPLLPGEHVLVLDWKRQGKGKLSDRWESQPYVVVTQPYPDRPVYRVRPEGKDGPERILHHNNLCPCLPCLTPRATETTELQVTETNEGIALWGYVLPFYLGGGVGEAQAPELRRSQRVNRWKPLRYQE